MDQLIVGTAPPAPIDGMVLHATYVISDAEAEAVAEGITKGGYINTWAILITPLLKAKGCPAWGYEVGNQFMRVRQRKDGETWTVFDLYEPVKK